MSQLVDRFGRAHTYLRISVTDRCNLRCVYCMPQEGMTFQPREELLTFEEIERVARVFVAHGITKIRITGGEPLVRKDVTSLMANIARIPGVETLALTTNGVLLKDHAAELKTLGLKALNISLDTFCEERFTAIAQRSARDFNAVLDGVDMALTLGFESLKLNVVVMGGVNDDELLDFVDFTEHNAINVRFIEFMPFKDTGWQPEKLVPYAEIRRHVEDRYKLLPLVTEPSAVAKDFAIPGHKGTVSFITSMSDSFCGTCNRLRLTADGAIKSCLFHPAEVNIRDALRLGISDDELVAILHNVLDQKPEAHPPVHDLAESPDNRPMIAIGG